MTITCFLLTYIVEQFISYIYFSNKFELKRTYLQIILMYFSSFVIQFSVHYIGIPELNLISFLICNIFATLLLFNCSIKQACFNTLLLEGIMITSELAVMHLTSFLLNVDLHIYLQNENILVLETICTKTFYFTLAYLISKISFKEKREKIYKDISTLLFLLPLSSICAIISFTYLSVYYEIDKHTKLLFAVVSFVLLGTNIIIFLVHEKMISTLTENTNLQLEKQRAMINKEYYEELQKQYDSSNILIHDIKRHLSNIKDLSATADFIKIADYIDSVYKGYEIKELRQYSCNKIVNIIFNRYAQLCRDNSIALNVDVRNVDFSFISDSDLTALLDNLLENSYEAAKVSKEKTIDCLIDIRNENYIIIDVINSADIAPRIKNKRFLTIKRDKGLHGIGIKSIARIVKRYSGNAKYTYDDTSNEFHAIIILKSL